MRFQLERILTEIFLKWPRSNVATLDPTKWVLDEVDPAKVALRLLMECSTTKKQTATYLIANIMFQVQKLVFEEFLERDSGRWIIDQQPAQNIPAIHGDFRKLGNLNFLLVFYFIQKLIDVFRAIRCAAKQAFVQNDADAPEIGRRTVRLLQKDLRCHVQRWTLYHCVLFT